MRNSSLVEGFCADNLSGLSLEPKLWLPKLRFGWGRGAFLGRRSCSERSGGAQGSANAGMSSEKMRENRIRRKPEVSYATSFGVGLVGPKSRPKGVDDG